MTLKFESEILFDLMKRDGDDTPSDVLPYESELKEKYLNQVVGAYPKLQDYRPEWLNYNLYHHLPSDFPTESVTNVTSASFHDVVPYSYGCAILKGQTLMNLLDYSHSYSKNFTKQENGHWTISVNNNSGTLHLYIPLNQPLKDKTLYTIIVDITKNNLSKEMRLINGFTTGNAVDVPLGYIGKLKLAFMTNSSAAKGWNGDLQTVMTAGTTGEIELGDYILLEGDYTNVDIPYFEGMTSVQMPVLSTVGKNLFDKTKLSGGEFATFNGKSVYSYTDGGINFKYNSKFKENTQYTFTGKIYRDDENNSLKVNFNFYYTDGTRTTNNEDQGSLFTLTSKKDKTIDYISGSYNFNRSAYLDLEVAQLEEGSVATSYEPFKSNILTVNEDVTLRGIDGVQDTLNCLTGELTTRTREIVYNSTDIIIGKYPNKENTFNLFFDDKSANTRSIMVDKIPVMTGWTSFLNNFNLSCSSLQNGHLYVTIPNANTAEEAKTYLSNLNPTFLYILAEESIKTVDLTCINEQGESETLRPIEGTMHVKTSSQTLLPLLDMSVPVEATSQNLMSFANIEEEEK